MVLRKEGEEREEMKGTRLNSALEHGHIYAWANVIRRRSVIYSGDVSAPRQAITCYCVILIRGLLYAILDQAFVSRLIRLLLEDEGCWEERGHKRR